MFLNENGPSFRETIEKMGRFTKETDFRDAINSRRLVLPPGSNDVRIEAFWKANIESRLQSLAQAMASGRGDQVVQIIREIQQELSSPGAGLTSDEVRVLLQFIIDVFEDVFEPGKRKSTSTSPSSPPPRTPRRTPDKIRESWPELNENVLYFLEFGTGLVGPEFLRIVNPATGNLEWIDLLKTDFTQAEKQKILRDFHLLILIQSDIILDDVAGDDGFAAGNLKRLRIRGQWKLESDAFTQNPHRQTPSDPKSIENWAEALPAGLKSLLYTEENLMKAYINMSNVAKDVINLFPESKGKRGGDKEIIDSLKSIKAEISFSIRQLIMAVTGSQYGVGTSAEIGYPKEPGETVRDSVLGDLVRESVFAFDRMFRGIAVTDGPNPRPWGDIFPHARSETVSQAYAHILAHLENVFDQVVDAHPDWKPIFTKTEVDAHGNTVLSSQSKQLRDLYLKWGIQTGFDLAWTYFQALGYDKKSMISSFAEGMNALTYHLRDDYGIPAKTVYGAELDANTSKPKTPRVTDRARYYYSSLEFMHIPSLLHTEDIEILGTASEIENFFRTELVTKYGGMDQRNNSQEYLQLLGQIPEDMVFDAAGNINFGEIARHFVLIRVKPEKTAYDPSSRPSTEQQLRWSPDAMLVRRSSIQQDLDGIARGSKRHIKVWASVYDTLFRYKFPLFDHNSQLPLVQWQSLDTSPAMISSNYGDALSHEYSFFMEPASADKVSLLTHNARDLIEWSVNAEVVGGLFADIQGLRNRAMDLLPRSMSKRVLEMFRRNPDKEIGAQMYSMAVQLVNVAPYSIKGDSFSRWGLDKYNDKYFTYYLQALLMGESSKDVAPKYDPSGQLTEIQYVPRVNERVPFIWDSLYRNIFIPWSEQPLYKSRRTYEIQRELDDPATLADKNRREIANTWLQIEGALTSFNIYISQYMPHPSPSWTKAQDDPNNYDEAKEIIDQYHVETHLARTIISDEEIYLRMPEDVQSEAKIMTEFIMRKFANLFRKINGREHQSDSELQSFIERTKPSGLVKDSALIDTWGMTREEIYQSLLALYSYNNISSGPSAAGVAFDWLALATRGQVARFARTREIIDHVRETRHDAGLFGFGRGFAPPPSGKK